MPMILQLDSVNRWLGDGVTTDWDFSFSGGYIDRKHVRTYVADAEGVRVYHEPEFIQDFRVRILPAAPVGSKVTVFRFTPRDLPLVEFEDGTALTEAALNLMARQAVFIAAEFTDATTVVVDGNLVNALDDITAVLNIWATSTLEDRLAEWKTELEGDLLTYINTHLPPAVDLDPYGFKEMVHTIYSGSSAVSTADRGRAHVKPDGTSVSVPSTLATGFTCNVINLSAGDMTVTFSESAYMQGSAEFKYTWALKPNQILHVTKVATGKWLISGYAT